MLTPAAYGGGAQHNIRRIKIIYFRSLIAVAAQELSEITTPIETERNKQKQMNSAFKNKYKIYTSI